MNRKSTLGLRGRKGVGVKGNEDTRNRKDAARKDKPWDMAKTKKEEGKYTGKPSPPLDRRGSNLRVYINENGPGRKKKQKKEFIKESQPSIKIYFPRAKKSTD